jgi:hypothetical protein
MGYNVTIFVFFDHKGSFLSIGTTIFTPYPCGLEGIIKNGILDQEPIMSLIILVTKYSIFDSIRGLRSS